MTDTQKIPPAGTIADRVRQCVSRVLIVMPEDVTLESHFINDLNADSLENVEITMELEDEFGIQIPDEDADKIETVQQAIDYVTRVKGGA